MAAIIARCSCSRSRNRASPPTALRRFPESRPTRFILTSSASARSARRVSAAICASRVSTGLRPRGLPSSLTAPSLRCLRQYVRCDVYSPSRRSSSPTSPGLVHASASARIRALYSAVNERRLACSTSSGSGDPLRRGAPASPKAQLGYASLVFGAGGNLSGRPSSVRARLHAQRSPFSPSRSVIPRW